MTEDRTIKKPPSPHRREAHEKTTKHWTDRLIKLGIGEHAAQWAKGYKSPQAAWEACGRGDWMMHVVSTVAAGTPESKARRKLVRTACECAELGLSIFKKRCPPEGHIESLIRITGEWVRGNATLAELHKARRTVAAYTSAYADIAAAADTAAHTADSSNAADYTTDADDDAGIDVAQGDFLRRFADIVRTHYPTAPKC